jgi:tRNA A-37 threonylcarbamoyl transferase component Bud32/WD40 repeat protein
MSDDDEPGTKREIPARKGWMAATVGADTVAPAPRETVPLALSISVFDPPDQRFAEKSELGRGGMGRVVEAVDRALGRSVAIKQSLATTSVDLARFEREVRITAQLQHPSVIPILDVGRDPEGRPFYIMRKIEGEPLADRVDAAPTVRDRVALVSALLGAIDAAAYAHAKGIIHRDIKPWNILLGPFGETLMIDWGIARQLDEEPDDVSTFESASTGTALTRMGVAQGTPGFLAPEQARGEAVDKRADVYSLGATLFFVLAGKIPYGRIDPNDAIARAAAGELPDFTWIPEEVPRELVAITSKAMAMASDQRYADAGELAVDLRRFLAGQLVAAHDYSTRERIVRWLRRHRVAATVSVLAVIAIAVVSTISIRQVLADRDAATDARNLAVERADERLIDRARSLVESDPTSAVALLRELPPESAHWPEALHIARAAVAGGVERRVAIHPGFVTAVAFSPDGKWLASASAGIVVTELARNTTRTIANLAVHELVWRDERTIAYHAHKNRAGTIDLVTGATHEYASEAQQIAVLNGRLIVRDKTGVAAYGADHQRAILFDGPSRAFDVRGGRIAILGTDRLVVIDGETTRTVPLAQPLASSHLRLSADGKRAAALDGLATIYEWQIDAPEQPPRTWPRPRRGLGEVGYVESTLYAWSSDGSGYTSLENALPHPRWTTRETTPGVLTRHLVPFEGGAILVTDGGQLAHATALGVLPAAHRPLSLKSVAVDTDGQRLALGTANGEVLVLDLSHLAPRTMPVDGSTRLVGAFGTQAIVFDRRELASIDLVTRARSVLAKNLDDGWEDGGFVIGARGFASRRTLTAWDTTGKELFEVPSVIAPRAHDGHLYYLDPQGVLWRRGFAGAAQRLGAIDPERDRFTRLNIVDGVPVIAVRSLLDETVQTRFLRFTASGIEQFAIDGSAKLSGRTPDGTWWGYLDSSMLWWAPHGVPVQLPLAHPVVFADVFGDKVWAFGKERITVLGGRGGNLESTIVWKGSPWKANDGVLLITIEGVVELIPSAHVRRTLRMYGETTRVAVTPGNKDVLALATLEDGDVVLARWTDPVPADPAALPAYLATITNARLAPGSDALRWDP